MNLVNVLMEIRSKKNEVRLLNALEKETNKVCKIESCNLLSKAGFTEKVRNLVNKSKIYNHKEVVSLANKVKQTFNFNSLSVEIISSDCFRGIVVLFTFNNIQPCILFETVKEGYKPKCFHFDYEESRVKKTATSLYKFSLH